MELTIGDQTLQFNSVTDVAFCLEGRTSVSSTKLAELFALSAEELETQAQSLADLNKQMFGILNAVVDEPDNIDRAMRELDTQMFSQDQNWREIIQSLNKEQGEINSIRVTVIMKYMKYLTALEDTISHVRAGIKKNETAAVDATPDVDYGATWSLSTMHEEANPAPATQAAPKLKPEVEQALERLPKDQAVSVLLPPGRRMKILLASYPGQIVATNDSVQYVDESGATILSKGANIVGRSIKNTVMIDPAQRHVSRSHLTILINEGNALQLTDHSTEGTYISSEFLQ